MAQLISQALGATESYTITLYDSSGNPITSFTGTEVPAAKLWQGGDSAVLASPAVAWLSAPAGTLTLTVTAANTSALSAGQFRIQVTIPATAQVLWDGVLQLTDAPGTATPLSTYCSFQDMVNWWPSISDFESYHASTQFMWQRHQARTWLEEVIQRHSPRIRYAYLGTPLYGPNAWYSYAEQGTDPVLQGYLDANLLIVTSRVIELQAKRALGLALISAVGTDDRASAYQQAGRAFLAEAEALLCGYVAEIDFSPQDGYSDLRIPIGVTSSR